MCWQNKAEIMEKLNCEPAVALMWERILIFQKNICKGGSITTSDWVY